MLGHLPIKMKEREAGQRGSKGRAEGKKRVMYGEEPGKSSPEHLKM